MNIQGKQHGFGRVGLDFWPVLPDKRGRMVGSIQARYPQTSWENLDHMTKAFVPPGPDGAMFTSRLELMREGIQETEARIFIEKALTDPALRRRLGEPLAEQCQDILHERTRAVLMAMDNHISCGLSDTRSTDNHTWWGNPGQVNRLWLTGSGWQQRSETLYSALAEVAKAVGPVADRSSQ